MKSIDKKGIWSGATIKESCIAHYMMGATTRGYSFIEMHGCVYALCYRCTQSLCGIGRPIKDEMYPCPTGISMTGGVPRGGKEMKRDVVICYEVPAIAKSA